MFQRVKDAAARVAAWPGRAWSAAEAWLVSHRQGFVGFVLGALAGGVLAALASRR